MTKGTYWIFALGLSSALVGIAAPAQAATQKSPLSKKTPDAHHKAGAKPAAGHDKHPPGHWSYEGAGGPAHWGSLSASFALCKTGRFQTPVNLVPSAKSYQLPSLEFDYRAMPLNMVNNGHTGQMTAAPGSTLGAGLRRYEMLQFHFHTPSEHTYNGKRYPMELHFVHKSREGALAVLGVMFVEGKENPHLAQLWKHLPAKEGAANPAGVTINPANLLPAKKTFVHYSPGSLTTPPCSEGLEWYVLSTPVEASRKQIAGFQKIFGNNSRPLQPIGSRVFMVGGR